MKLFIDTNIWIYYLSPNTELDSFKKLRNLIKEKKVELVIPRQMHQEYLKHSTRKIEEERNKISQEIKIAVPDGLSKNNKVIIQKIESINKELKELTAENIKSFETHIKQLEDIIEELFSLANFIEENDKVLDNAEKRFFKNLPPKKDSKKGDAIIWETLKLGIKNDKLAIIAKDSDYSDTEKGEEVIKRLLKEEWEKYTGKTVVLYTSLGSFINTIEKKKIISEEVIKQEMNLGNVIWQNVDATSYGTSSVMASAYPSQSSVTYIVSSGTPNNIVSGTSPIAFSSSRRCVNCGKFYIFYSHTAGIDTGFCNECRNSGMAGVTVVAR